MWQYSFFFLVTFFITLLITLFVTLFVTLFIALITLRKLENRHEKREIFSRYFLERDEKREIF